MSPTTTIEDSMDPWGLDTPAAVVIMRESMFVTRITVAMLALVLCDMCCTFPGEVHHIWGSKRSIYISLYWFMRFFTPLILLLIFIVRTSTQIPYHKELCTAYVWFIPLATHVVPSAIGEALMMMRTWTLYGCTRRMFYILIVTFIVRNGLVTALHLYLSNSTVVYFVPQRPGCTSSSIPHRLLFFMSLSASFLTASLLFALTLTKFIQQVQDRHSGKKYVHVLGLISRYRATGIFGTFLQDASFYTLVALIGEIIFTILVLQDQFLLTASLPTITAIYGLSSTRLVLMLRSAASQLPYSSDLDIELSLASHQ